MRSTALGLGLCVCFLALGFSGSASAQVAYEQTELTCSNGVDDDLDGRSDCDDVSCRAFTFCAQRPTTTYVAASRDEVSTRSLVWMQVMGAVMWGAVYLTGIGVTAAVGGSGAEIGLNAIPLAGPWMCLAGMCENPGPYSAGLITSGAVQIAGLLFLVIGSAIRLEERRELVSVVPWLDGNTAGGAITFAL